MTRKKIYIGLVHSPVINQRGQEVITSVTNLDIHDLARLAATYNLEGYIIIQPLLKQLALLQELLDYWEKGAGAEYNNLRKIAISKVKAVKSVSEAIAFIKDKEGVSPKIVATGARRRNDSVSYSDMRNIINAGGVYFILFGTGWGLSETLFKEADYILEPIMGHGEYNHLSVRGAAAIIIDRICCERWW